VIVDVVGCDGAKGLSQAKSKWVRSGRGSDFGARRQGCCGDAGTQQKFRPLSGEGLRASTSCAVKPRSKSDTVGWRNG
jgi:hypothetical protein